MGNTNPWCQVVNITVTLGGCWGEGHGGSGVLAMSGSQSCAVFTGVCSL